MRGAFDAEVEDDFFEFGIGGVAMGFPVIGMGVEFDRPFVKDVVDGACAIEKIRARSVIPLSELLDLDVFTIKALEASAEMACEEERLQLDFA